MTYDTAGAYTPNGDIKQCQCVMRHSDLKEGAIPQCGVARCVDSNLFCLPCENRHGAYWREKHPESVKA